MPELHAKAGMGFNMKVQKLISLDVEVAEWLKKRNASKCINDTCLLAIAQEKARQATPGPFKCPRCGVECSQGAIRCHNCYARF